LGSLSHTSNSFDAQLRSSYSNTTIGKVANTPVRSDVVARTPVHQVQDKPPTASSNTKIDMQRAKKSDRVDTESLTDNLLNL
jgi:hypothetical protein